MIWIALAFLFVGVIINCVISDAHPGIWFGTLLACVGFALLAATHYEAQPTAMDVYKGKTTLELTYKDGIPIDTVVVFKNK